jgi:pimeloyl-ACP methyl ester carboxylesterase
MVGLPWTDFYTPKHDGIEQHTPIILLNHSSLLGSKCIFVLLHGFLGSKHNFASLETSLGVQQLDQQQRRIVAVDLRNHGNNTEHLEIMNYPAMAKAVLQFLDSRQGLPKVIRVGHSVSGKVT